MGEILIGKRGGCVYALKKFNQILFIWSSGDSIGITADEINRIESGCRTLS